MIATGATEFRAYTATPAGAGSANAKGAWSQLVAATPFAGTGLLISCGRDNIDSALFDVGIGAGGSEKVLVPNIMSCKGGTGFYLPVSVREGERLATRWQHGSAGGSQRISVVLVGQGYAQLFPPCSRVTDYGTDLTNTRGVLMQPTPANTKTGWTELSSGITYAIHYLVVFHQMLETSSAFRIDIGIGGAGAEKVIIPDIVYNGFSGASSTFGAPTVSTWPVSIPAGTRLATRCQVNDPFFNIRNDFTVSVLGVG